MRLRLDDACPFFGSSSSATPGGHVAESDGRAEPRHEPRLARPPALARPWEPPGSEWRSTEWPSHAETGGRGRVIAPHAPRAKPPSPALVLPPLAPGPGDAVSEGVITMPVTGTATAAAPSATANDAASNAAIARNAAVLNPYTLAELVAGRRLNWKRLTDRPQLLEDPAQPVGQHRGRGRDAQRHGVALRHQLVAADQPDDGGRHLRARSRRVQDQLRRARRRQVALFHQIGSGRGRRLGRRPRRC